MNLKARLLLPATAAAALSGCNMVMSEGPMFAKADGATAPPIRSGVWRSEVVDCAVDETLPQDKWPGCASASPSVGDPPIWLEVSGDPILLQTPSIPIPDAQGPKAYSLFVAIRPLKLDAQGRVIAMKTWTVRCGPPPPLDAALATAGAADSPPPRAVAPRHSAPASPGLFSPTDPSSVTRLYPPPADAASPGPAGPNDPSSAELSAAVAQLTANSNRLSAAIAKMSPTKAPLPGLVMNKLGGCTPVSAEALRNAAKASEAWADDNPISHWVRERGPGDLPALSPANLMARTPPS
jgi:hypothetical protein